MLTLVTICGAALFLIGITLLVGLCQAAKRGDRGE
jgi:hypothetical protein